MTNVQICIREYIYQVFKPSSVNLIPSGEDKIKVINSQGKDMTLTMNIFGDIMDADTKQIYAVSDLPHDMNKIGWDEFRERLPHKWEEVGINS